MDLIICVLGLLTLIAEGVRCQGVYEASSTESFIISLDQDPTFPTVMRRQMALPVLTHPISLPVFLLCLPASPCDSLGDQNACLCGTQSQACSFNWQTSNGSLFCACCYSAAASEEEPEMLL
ncbi:unnamed protein product [Tetraodon nigroviridis]|uniref:(spotted green pufferfish) hypothetical protein n=1 Tax=Tetraodon nigroviridis TaxID=99883 RepID=Q4SBZ9_TETNG|nr:unnamed protein product [Tetraodon nigroviridis]